ncbi:MAG TPA: serine/threonine-protein kinase [Gemmatimonadaceae bacterium]|nr:serine/threonine-protein kinase [Gemmatimonadaceae bacterium]
MTRIALERFREVDRLLDMVLDLAPNERDAYLARACGDDTALRDEVRALVESASQLGGFLESPAVELGARLLQGSAPGPVSVGVPERAGPFRIVRELGHGGMGVVYLAEREGGAFSQRVALKMVRHLGRGGDAQRRFLEERRILALLEHPGIARLIDGGVTPEGISWFAMELVEGDAIDVYCDARQLPIDQRLDLFLAVCDAVQYAHEHLVVHRDLKPSNILVRGDGQLKLLDFGIAKLLDPLRPPEAGDTRTGVLALTPEYASPEQIRGELVSAATDTYALGVLLYVLLTGRRPYEVRGLSPAELERVICEVDPPRPSSTLGSDDALTRAAARGTTRDRLRRQLHGDVDLIVMRALHKDPARRYSSAAALREDVRRYRAGLPVLARPDSAAYRLRKFVQRNRAPVALAITVAVVLVGATAFSLGQMRNARRQRDVAVRAAQRATAMAELQAVLASDSRTPDGQPIGPEERIALAEQVLRRQFRGEPWLVAELMVELSNRYSTNSDLEALLAMLARARTVARDADLPAQVAFADCIRSSAFWLVDKLDSARVELTEARTAAARAGDAADEVIRAACLEAEGKLLQATGHADSGIAMLERAADLVGDSIGANSARVMNSLADVLRLSGRPREAIPIQQRLLNAFEDWGRGDTNEFPSVVAVLERAWFDLGEFAAIDSALGAIISRRERAYGPGQVATLLAFLYGQNKLRLGELDSADVWIGRALRDTSHAVGGLVNWMPPALAQLRLEQGRLREAQDAADRLPGGLRGRRATAAVLRARLLHARGERGAAARLLEREMAALYAESPKTLTLFTLPLVTAGEWRLALGDARGADSLARLAVSAATLDTLTATRSGLVGRSELLLARALVAQGNGVAGREAAARAAVALTNGYGPSNQWPRQAHALVDSLSR